MDLFQTIALSAVEGITEFLPVSSTGHLILTADLLKITQSEFVKSFEISIQLGAILAIVFLYWKTLVSKARFKIWSRILTAFIPTAIVGFILYKLVKSFLIGNVPITLFAIFAGGVLIIAFEKLYKAKEFHLQKIEDCSYSKCFAIGVVQSVSIIPGVSRAAATILGGLFVGLNRKTAVEFSFLLAIPTMIGATGLDLFKTKFQFSFNEYLLLAVGFSGAFITALITVKFFLKYIEGHSFVVFGIYRIILTLFFWIFLTN